MRRLFRIMFGFIAAMLAAGAMQVMFALPPAEVMALDEAARADRLFEMGALILRAATHSAIFCIGLAPVAILIGELQRLRGWTYYTVAGIIISLGGFLAEYASENAAQPTIVNTYALIAFTTTGAVGGFIYWMMSGRNAGRRRPVARIRVAGDHDAGTWESGDSDSGVVDMAATGRGMGDGKDASKPSAQDGHNPNPDTPDTTKDGQHSATVVRPMTSVPTAGPKIPLRTRLQVADALPDGNGEKTNKD